MKLDLSKAYDISSWLYLRLIPLHICFCVQKVIGLFVFVLGHILFFNHLLIIGLFFKPLRAFKQGCPLTPLMFLIIIEELRRFIIEAKRVGALIGIKLGRHFFLTTLSFVNDVFLFCDNSKREVQKLKEIID